jgi:glycosyltransferase involved in cell wall biosynthesis
MKKIRVLFITPSLKPGGTEKIISYLYNNINRNKFDAKLLVVGFESENHYQINDDNVVYLNKKRFRFSLFKIYTNIMRGNHDIIFSSSFHINIFLSLVRLFLSKRRMIIRESSIFSGMKKYRKKSIIPFFILKLLYNNIDLIIFQSSEMQKDFVTLFRLKSNYQIINNPITMKREALIKNNYNKYFNILNIGSLERLKGHERIINLLLNTKQKYRLSIYGSGSLKEELNLLIEKLKLYSIELKGVTKKVSSIFTQV